MAGYILLGTLAAFGLVSGLWVAYGLLLPRDGEGTLYAPARGEQALSIARRYLWLWELGLVRCPLILVDMGLNESERRWLTDRGITIRSPSEAFDGLKTGEKEH